jgi:hypothetical protein
MRTTKIVTRDIGYHHLFASVSARSKPTPPLSRAYISKGSSCIRFVMSGRNCLIAPTVVAWVTPARRSPFRRPSHFSSRAQPQRLSFRYFQPAKALRACTPLKRIRSPTCSRSALRTQAHDVASRAPPVTPAPVPEYTYREYLSALPGLQPRPNPSFLETHPAYPQPGQPLTPI